MSQQFLDAAQVRPAIQQMRRERMPQPVRGNRDRQLRLLRIPLGEPVHLPDGQAAELLAHKQRIRDLQPLRGPCRQIPVNRPQGGLADRTQPFALALAAHDGGAGNRIHVLEVQPRQLAHPHPRRVERFENRAVAQALPRAGGRLLQQPHHLLLVEKLRQHSLHPRRGHDGGGILLQDPFAAEKPEKAAHAGEAPGDGALRVRLGAFLGEEPADVQRRHGTHALMAEEPEEADQIVMVAAKGVRRGVALHRQIAEKPIDRERGALLHYSSCFGRRCAV